MAPPIITVYGATGHTGRLVATELLARGHPVVLGGRNPDALAEALRALATEPERGREMGRKGQQAVRDRFTAEHMTRETVAVYEHYLKGRV